MKDKVEEGVCPFCQVKSLPNYYDGYGAHLSPSECVSVWSALRLYVNAVDNCTISYSTKLREEIVAIIPKIANYTKGGNKFELPENISREHLKYWRVDSRGAINKPELDAKNGYVWVHYTDLSK